MATAKLDRRKPVTLAYIERVEPYANIPFNRITPNLYAWVKEKKVIPGFYPMAV